MSRAALLVALPLLTACAAGVSEPGWEMVEPDLVGQAQPERLLETFQPDSGAGAGGGPLDVADWVRLELEPVELDGALVGEGTLCSDSACLVLVDGAQFLMLEDADDVAVSLKAQGHPSTRWQLDVPSMPDSVELVQVSDADLDRLLAAFGTEQDPELGMALVEILAAEGASAALDQADGPFYVDASGQPLVGAERSSTEQGYALFLNVAPGSRSLQLGDVDNPCAPLDQGMSEPVSRWTKLPVSAGLLQVEPLVDCDALQQDAESALTPPPSDSQR